jgi:hypothetical protein
MVYEASQDQSLLVPVLGCQSRITTSVIGFALNGIAIFVSAG